MHETDAMSGPAHDSGSFDEWDLALVHALQIYPRAPWTLLGPILGLDPATLTRRWARLVEGGYARVTTAATKTQASRVCTAVVEIDCAPGQALQVATILAHDSHTILVDRLAGRRDLLIVVVTADLPAMERYVTDRVGQLPGVQRVASHLMTGFHAESGSWRLSALDPEQCARIEHAYQRPPRRSAPRDPRDDELLLLLHIDGRRSYTELAAHLDVSANTVRRRMDRLEATGYLEWQCDFARPLVGWPVAAIYWATAPTGHAAQAGRTLAALPETRFCVTVAGPHNIILGVYLHSIADTDRFEAELSARLPELVIYDRAISYHTVKTYSYLLDAHGRSIGIVAPVMI